MDEKDFEEYTELMRLDENTFADKASEAVAEVMHKLEDLQKAIQDNSVVLRIIDFGCVIGMSVTGPVNIEDCTSPTEEFPGHMLTRTVIGNAAECKAITTIIAKHIADAEKEVDNG